MDIVNYFVLYNILEQLCDSLPLLQAYYTLYTPVVRR